MWTPSLRAFRICTGISLLLIVIYIADWHWLIIPVSHEELPAFQWVGINAIVPVERAVRLWYLIYGTLAISLAFMIRLHDWSRWTALIAVVISYLSSPFFGLSVWPTMHALLYNCGWALIDVTLAMAFLTPIALRFNGEYADGPPRDDADDAMA